MIIEIIKDPTHQIAVIDVGKQAKKHKTVSIHLNSWPSIYLINSIPKELAENFDFIKLTTYEIYNLISSMNVNHDNDLIEEIKNLLEREK